MASEYCGCCGRELPEHEHERGMCMRCARHDRIMDEIDYWDDLDNPPSPQPERTDE